jgi:beta-galactosidase
MTAAKDVPAEGLTFSYNFTLAETGKREIWVRVGHEWDRSPFQWRVDGGAWSVAASLDPTMNLQRSGEKTGTVLGWLRLAERELSAGKHTLSFCWGRPETGNLVGMLDCACVAVPGFVPNYKWKPGENYRNELAMPAAGKVYEVPAARGAERVEVSLNDLWEAAPWDLFLVDEPSRLRGERELPALQSLHWYGMKAPGSIDNVLSSLSMSQRCIMRTRFSVSEGGADRGYQLDFQRFGSIVSVFVNGVYCGESKGLATGWRCDVSTAVKTGKNELALVFKGPVYGLLGPIYQFRSIKEFEAEQERHKKLGNRLYWSPRRQDRGCAGLPTRSAGDFGFTEPLTLISAGSVYAGDVFCKPSVVNKRLDIELTVFNALKQDAEEITIRNEVIPWNSGRGGPAECVFKPLTISWKRGAVQSRAPARQFSLSQTWDNPRLWWPDNPHLYWLKTIIEVDGKVVDERLTRFGFRELDWSTHVFKINGVRWHMWADQWAGKSIDEFLKYAQRTGRNNFRIWNHGPFGMPLRAALERFDEAGMLVRFTGIMDGQVMGYCTEFGRPDTSLPRDKNGRWPNAPNEELFSNWHDQLEAWVRTFRNHPSIYIWSLENEITYIASNNSNNHSLTDPAMLQAWQRLHVVDPTRPVMVDGGNCLRDESLPVNGSHYGELSGCSVGDMPDAAYTARERWYNTYQRGAWRMVENRPIMCGEEFFANGHGTEGMAWIGGESSFLSLTDCRPARDLFARVLSEGYRWNDVASWHFWLEDSATKQRANSWSPVAVHCRQWNWTFGPGEKIARTLRVYNNTSKSDPIAVVWSYSVDGKRVDGGERTCALPAGGDEIFEVAFTVPSVPRRSAAAFLLTAVRGGQEVFRDEKPSFVLGPDALDTSLLKAGDLAVYDPRGDVKRYLAARRVAFTDVPKPDGIADSAKIIIVGTDAIRDGAEAGDVRWLRYAAAGKRVIVLDQSFPLRGQAIPADALPTERVGRIGFSENLRHKVFAGFEQPDFFTWDNDHILYRNAYRKGTRGGKSLLQCDDRLQYTALLECPVNDGLLVLNQLAIGSRLERCGTARRMLANLLAYAADYRQVITPVTMVMNGTNRRAKALQSLGLTADAAADPVAALAPEKRIVIVDASAQNLAKLAAAMDRVDAFTAAGGWLFLWGLTPEGLGSYNKVVQAEHFIRPFAMEKVTLPDVRDGLTDGLTLRDVVMDTGERVFKWMSMKFPDHEAFTYVIDHLDAAPFAKMPSLTELGVDPKMGSAKPGFDHYPYNMFNGFSWRESWRFIYALHAKSGYKTKWPMTFARSVEMERASMNFSYTAPAAVRFWFGDDPKAVEFPAQSGANEFDLGGRKAKVLTVEIVDPDPAKGSVMGIDSFRIEQKRAASYLKAVRPLLKTGALMRYDRGAGGILLCQLNLLDSERNPVNSDKKRNILRVLLGNLGAQFGGGQMLVSGSKGLRYEPVKLPDNIFNEFPNRLGTSGANLSAVPGGNQVMGGIEWNLADFLTSPIPGIIVLKGKAGEREAVTRIPVGRKADALFFLHTFNRNDDGRKWQSEYDKAAAVVVGRGSGKSDKRLVLPELPVVFQYVVHYEDGQSVTFPVRLNDGVQHWLQAGKPADLTAAKVAWSRPMSGLSNGVLYAMPWNNPRPQSAIASVDMVPASDEKDLGTPALFAISAGSMTK